MEREIQPPLTEALADNHADDPALATEPLALPEIEEEYRGLRWVFVGDDGLRAGWSVLIFAVLLELFSFAVGTLFFELHLVGTRGGFSARAVFFGELIPV